MTSFALIHQRTMATKPGFSFDAVKKTVLREVHEVR